MEIIPKIGGWYKALPEKKPYVEFITAVLTVPVLLTVIVNNVNSLRNNKTMAQGNTPSPSPASSPVVKAEIRVSAEPVIPTRITPNPASPAASPTDPAPCKKSLGPAAILQPEDGETVKNDPVTIDISYPTGEYCAAVWSYRIDSGNWSEYSDKSVNIYGMEPGRKNLQVKVKSLTSGEETILQRTFIYSTPITPTAVPTIQPTAASSASPSATPAAGAD